MVEGERAESAVLGTLVVDRMIYPRCGLDKAHARRLGEAYRSGAQLPPLIADRKTKKIIDGAHRRQAMIDLYGPGHQAAVIFRDYPTLIHMLLDAASINAKHGLTLTIDDMRICVDRARAVGLDVGEITKAMNIRADALRGRTRGESLPLQASPASMPDRPPAERPRHFGGRPPALPGTSPPKAPAWNPRSDNSAYVISLLNELCSAIEARGFPDTRDVVSAATKGVTVLRKYLGSLNQ